MPARFLLPVVSVLLLGWISCTRDPARQSVPPVSPEVMERLLFDLQVADVYSTMLQPDSLPPVNVKNKDSLAFFYHEILSHHGITEDELMTAMKWYEEHPAELEAIYGRIQAHLTELGNQYQE